MMYSFLKYFSIYIYSLDCGMCVPLGEIMQFSFYVMHAMTIKSDYDPFFQFFFNTLLVCRTSM